MRSIVLLALGAIKLFAVCNGMALATTVSSKDNQADKVVLRWEGHNPFSGWDDAERCQRLVITRNQAQYGKCSEKPQTGQVALHGMVRQFAAFEYRSSDATLTFNGRGKVAGGVWQRAIATWARFTFAEVYGGHACASCRNVLEWSFGPIPDRAGYRGMLVVLNYGYAIRFQAPGEGGEAKVVAQGWLTTEEWTQLDNWVQTRASQNVDKTNSIDGKGIKQMSPPEIDALRKLARKVYDRLQKK